MTKIEMSCTSELTILYIYGKTIEKFRKQNRSKTSKEEKDYISKPRYMSHKIFDNNLVAICKRKLALTLKHMLE